MNGGQRKPPARPEFWECEIPAEPAYETILGSRREMAIKFRSSRDLTSESPIAAYA